MRPVVDTNNPVNFDHPANRGLLDWRMVLPDVWRGSSLPDLVTRKPGDFNALLDPKTAWISSKTPGRFGEIDFGDATADQRIILQPGTRYVPVVDAPVTIVTEGTPTQFFNTDFGNRLFSMPQPSSGTAFLVGFDRRDADGSIETASAFYWDGGTRRFLAVVSRFSPCQFGITYDGTQSHAYINGAFIASFTHSMVVPSATLNAQIGLQDGVVDWRFIGTFGFLRIHDRAMSGDEMVEQYHLSKRGFPGMLNTLSGTTTFPFGDIFTAAAALTRGGAAFDADATTEPPVFTASADLTRGGSEFDASGTTTGPVFTASADMASGAAEFDASATATGPVFTASADVERGGAEFSADAVFADNVFSASADVTAGAAEFNAEATFEPGPVTATAELQASVGVLDASATFTNDVSIGSADLTAPVGKFLALESAFGVTRYLVIGYGSSDVLMIGQ